MPFSRFNITKISKELEDFLKNFPAINAGLSTKREPFTRTMLENILQAYAFLNELLESDIDLFLPSGLHHLLELNHLVLCGRDPKTRTEYFHHIDHTRKKFNKRIHPIRDWVLKHRRDKDPFELAAGFYAKALSKPQLFLEGNHRTGNIILNYLLLSRGQPPYVISVSTAREYLELSGDIKFTDSENTFESAFKLPGRRTRFREFLARCVDERFLLQPSPWPKRS